MESELTIPCRLQQSQRDQRQRVGINPWISRCSTCSIVYARVRGSTVQAPKGEVVTAISARLWIVLSSNTDIGQSIEMKIVGCSLRTQGAAPTHVV